jgi:hypothetical protein
LIGAPAAGAGLEYWTRRTAEHGARAVVNVEHPANRDLDSLTAEHRLVLLPALAALLDGSERVVCDLGCGAGRFTADFAHSPPGPPGSPTGGYGRTGACRYPMPRPTSSSR